MAGTDDAASEAARALVTSRWIRQGDPVLARAVETVTERRERLSDAQRAQLHEVTAPPGGEADGEG